MTILVVKAYPKDDKFHLGTNMSEYPTYKVVSQKALEGLVTDARAWTHDGRFPSPMITDSGRLHLPNSAIRPCPNNELGLDRAVLVVQVKSVAKASAIMCYLGALVRHINAIQGREAIMFTLDI